MPRINLHRLTTVTLTKVAVVAAAALVGTGAVIAAADAAVASSPPAKARAAPTAGGFTYLTHKSLGDGAQRSTRGKQPGRRVG